MSLLNSIQFLFPDAQFVLVDEDYSTLVWEGPGEKPSEQTLRNAEAAADHAAAEEAVRMKRLAHYVAESDQLFFAWQAGEGTEESWQEKRNEIKQRFPIP